jgi:hypothetical protein
MSIDTGGFDVSGKLLSHIKKTFVPKPGKNSDAQLIFAAIKLMFDGSGSGDRVAVDPYLVHNLAACAEIALRYNTKDEIPWDKNDHDCIIVRTLTGMVNTLIDAIRINEVSRRDGKVYFGYFQIPEWLIRQAGK